MAYLKSYIKIKSRLPIPQFLVITAWFFNSIPIFFFAFLPGISSPKQDLLLHLGSRLCSGLGELHASSEVRLVEREDVLPSIEPLGQDEDGVGEEEGRVEQGGGVEEEEGVVSVTVISVSSQGEEEPRDRSGGLK